MDEETVPEYIVESVWMASYASALEQMWGQNQYLLHLLMHVWGPTTPLTWETEWALFHMLYQRFPIWWLVPRQGVGSNQDCNVNSMGDDENRGDPGKVHIVLEGTCWKVLQQSPWLCCPVLPSGNWISNLLRWCGIHTFFVTWLSSKSESGSSTTSHKGSIAFLWIGTCMQMMM